jgi:mRNA-degrading endonuclease toxin of MazEF toxin-antitoxin module
MKPHITIPLAVRLRLSPCTYQPRFHHGVCHSLNTTPFGRSRSGRFDAPDFRVTVDPTATNGLRVRSQVMADKPVTIRREGIGRRIGHLDDQDIAQLNVALAFVMGLAD